MAPGIAGVGFDGPFYDYFALVTRGGVRVSPGTMGLIELVDEWAAGVAARLIPR